MTMDAMTMTMDMTRLLMERHRLKGIIKRRDATIQRLTYQRKDADRQLFDVERRIRIEKEKALT